MITSFLETIDHDWALVDDTLFLCEDARAIAQHVEARLRLFLGEWFLDQREGVPYFEEVFIKNPDVPLVRSLLVNVITETPGVVSVTQTDFTFDSQQRVLYLAVSYSTDTGTTITLDTSFVLGDQ